MRRRGGLACAVAAALAALAVPAFAGPAPRRGGELRLAAVTEAETFDCHASTALGTAIHLLPHYSTLSGDGLAYRFELVPGVKFHDGTPLTSADIEATCERLRNPPASSPAPRKALFDDIASIETPDPGTLVFRLGQRNVAMPYTLANPWNCVYSAAKLASDPDYPANVMMGSGPFRLVEQVKGGVWRGERYAGYHRAGRPYVDGFRMYSMPLTTMMSRLEGNQIDGDMRGMAPSEAARIAARYPERFTEQQSSTLTLFMLAFNTEAPPFNDARVRRALSMAVDRLHAALKATSDAAEQRRLVRAIEGRVLGEQSYHAPLLWMQRSVLTRKEVHLPAILPSQFLNLDLADAWVEGD